MKKTKILLAAGLSLGLVLAGSNEVNLNQVAYASNEEDFKAKLEKEVKNSEDYKQSKEYKSANEAERKVYDMNIDYAKEVLAGEAHGKYEDIYKEIKSAKKEIESVDNSDMEESKARVNLRLKLYDVEELIKEAEPTAYTKPYLDKLKSQSYRARAAILNTELDKKGYENALEDLEDAVKAYKKSILDEKIIALKKAIRDNKESADAAKMLLKNYPNTVANIKDDLNALIEKSDKLIESAQALIDKIEK
ncbi:MAG: hypothetical protein Q4D88_05425 [Anaerococcus sp.]|nr:hypothetical protein [Anaerococcus sp.]